jgi:hypothetical protein
MHAVVSKLLVILAGVSVPDAYDQIAMEGTVQLEDVGPVGGYPWSAYAGAGDSQNDIKAACISAAEVVAGNHSWTYSGSTLIGWPDEAPADDDSGELAVPGASAAQSLSSGTPRQPSASRPVLVMVSGSWSWNLSALGTQTGSLTIKSDASATPTTVIRAPAWSRGISAGISIGDTGTLPVEFDLIVPPAHYYSVTAAGGATFTVREQVL